MKNEVSKEERMLEAEDQEGHGQKTDCSTTEEEK
jgi:hypothetical protein